MSYSPGKQIKVPERQLVEIWQHQLPEKSELITEDGRVVKIIYPGRINDDQGADFRDAVIATDQGLVKGDIELHVKSSDWRVHQHHHNPAYNRVILHVVMWRDTDAATILQNGSSVPVLALHKYVKIPPGRWPDGVYLSATLNMPCLKATEHLPPGTIAEALDSAGEERFLDKAARFQADLAQTEASQSLYQGIMGALGYSKNTESFLELARRLPLRILESMIQGKISDEECLSRQQTLLLGTAGLLPSQRRDEHQKNKLERLCTSSRQTEAMSPDAWHLFKVRPNNSPARRIVAMTHLLLHYRQKGIFDTIVNMIKKAPLNKGYLRLEQGLIVATSGYRAGHPAFGPDRRVRNQTLLGRRQADDIIVNVLLPFTFAWGELSSRPKLEKKAIALYRHYPRLAINTVERHMKQQLGLGSSLVNSARRQQGLIHIYNTLCTQGKCHCCPLGKETQASLRLGTTSKSRPSTLPALNRK